MNAPPPIQFPTLQFAGTPAMSEMMSKAGTALSPLARAAGQAYSAPAPGAAIPGAVGPTAVGGQQGPMPLMQPGAGPQPGIGNMLRNILPQGMQGLFQPPAPPQMPGAALFQQAGDPTRGGVY